MIWNKATRRKLLFMLIWALLVATFLFTGHYGAYRDPWMLRGTRHRLTPSDDKWLDEKLSRAAKHQKVILAWDGEEYKARYIRPESPTLPRECGSCLVTTQHKYVSHPTPNYKALLFDTALSQIHDAETAAVVVNYMSITKRHLPPKTARRPDQLYVFQAGEPPPLLKSMGHFQTYQAIDAVHFNETMMVWRDSGIYGPFGSARVSRKIARSTLRKRFHNDFKNVMKHKTKLSIVVISNCDAGAGAEARLDFTKALQKNGLAVDKFGACFQKQLPKTEHKLRSSDVVLPYKFYLSFENSFHCKDYITEKFFSNGLTNFAVPVVWGASKADYYAVAPPRSFIHVDDFKSLKDLIEYLKYLNHNDEAYLEYLKWIEDPVEMLPQYQRKYGFCQLCRIVHGINVDDIYSPSFDVKRLKRPLLTDKVSRRTIPPFKNLMESMEPKECFWKIKDFRNANLSLAARVGSKV